MIVFFTCKTRTISTRVWQST